MTATSSAIWKLGKPASLALAEKWSAAARMAAHFLSDLPSAKSTTCSSSQAFKCEEPVEVAESFTAPHLYRIAQEALTNALKHARPEHILIALESDNGQPTLLVADDGTGFDFSKKSEGVGLKIMQYRASLIGASLAISPVDMGGTLVTCKVFLGKGNSDDSQH